MNKTVGERAIDAYIEGHGGPETEGREWEELAWFGRFLRGLPEAEPSQMTINRILAYAREAALSGASPVRVPFWAPWWRPSATLAGFLILVTAAFLTYRAAVWDGSSAEIISAGRTAPDVPAPKTGAQVVTALPGLRGAPAASSDPTARFRLMGPFSFATPVSLGETSVLPEADAELDHKIETGRPLDDKDVDALFFRARRLERIASYREALKDYEFIALSRPGYPYIEAVEISIAKCLDALERKDEAILRLERFERDHGETDGVARRMDELKSESF